MATPPRKSKVKGQECPNCGYINKRSFTWCRGCKQELKSKNSTSKIKTSLRVSDSLYRVPDDYEETDDFFGRAEKLARNRKKIEHMVEEIRRRDEIHFESIKYLLLIILGSIALRFVITAFLSGRATITNMWMTILDITLTTIVSEVGFILSTFLLANFITFLQGNYLIKLKEHLRIIAHMYPAIFAASVFWISFTNRSIAGNAFISIIILALGVILGLMLVYDLVVTIRFEFRISYVFAIMVGAFSLFIRNLLFGAGHDLFNALLSSYVLQAI